MSFLSGLAKIGGLAASPFTFGLSALAGNAIGSALDKKEAAAKALGAAGSAIGSANTAAANNRQVGVQNALQANSQNISGTSAYENELMKRAEEDATQRKQALKDIYRNSWATNPTHSPYNPAGAPKFSPSYLAALKGLDEQGTARIAKPTQYGLDTLPMPAAYKPIDIKDVPGATGNSQSFLSKLGSWVSPALTVAGNFMGGSNGGGGDAYSKLPVPGGDVNDEEYYNFMNGGE